MTILQLNFSAPSSSPPPPKLALKDDFSLAFFSRYSIPLSYWMFLDACVLIVILEWHARTTRGSG